MIVRIHGEGDYSFPAWLDGIYGSFMTSDGRSDFSVELNDSFLGVILFGPPPSTCKFAASEQPGMTVNLEGRSEEIRLTVELVPSANFRASLGSVSQELGTSWSAQVRLSGISVVSNALGRTEIGFTSNKFWNSAIFPVSNELVNSRIVTMSENPGVMSGDMELSLVRTSSAMGPQGTHTLLYTAGVCSEQFLSRTKSVVDLMNMTGPWKQYLLRDSRLHSLYILLNIQIQSKIFSLPINSLYHTNQ
jgi:hypothetical protein